MLPHRGRHGLSVIVVVMCIMKLQSDIAVRSVLIG